MESHQSRVETKDQEVSEEFKAITQSIFDWQQLASSYKPSLAEIDYLGDYVMQNQQENFHTPLNLKRIIFTVETGSRFGKLLNSSQIYSITINIRSDGELALIRELHKIKMYYFYVSRIGFDINFYSLIHSLSKFVTYVQFRDRIIPDDDLKIVLSALKEKVIESKTFEYTVVWVGSTDFNELGFEELFECVERAELSITNCSSDGGNEIKIENISQANSFLHIAIDYIDIETNAIKRFLNQHKDKILIVNADEWEEACPLLMSINDVMKNLPMKLVIFWYIFSSVSEETANITMNSLIETNLDSLTIDIKNLSDGAFQIIFDKLKNVKLQNLELIETDLTIFNAQTVAKPIENPGLSSLCIQECTLNNRLSKQLFLKLKHSNLKKFSLIQSNFNRQLANVLSKSLITSNLTELHIKSCRLHCNQVKIIAKALKDTNITLIDLSVNEIKNDGVIAIANGIQQTKLNTLFLYGNEFNEIGAISLLKSIQKTKIVRCCIYNCNLDRSLDAIANLLKNNKILLSCIREGMNTKIDEYTERNYNSLKKAKLIIDKYQKDSILYDYKHKEHFEAYQSFIDTEILWDRIDNKEKIKLNLGNEIADNYLKICGVINNKLEVNNEQSKKLSDLSVEILNKICSFLSISDVVN